MKKILTLFFFLLVSVQGWAAKQSCDTLFILQDAGETHALLPVIEKYVQNKERFLILTGGTATEIVARKPALKDKIISFASFGIPEQINKSWKRDEKISEQSLKKIESEIEASTIVSGVAFELQGQLLEAYKARKKLTFAYWDNVNFEGTDAYFQTAKKVAQVAGTLLVPSTAFKNSYPQARVVGKPSLELWKQQMRGIQLSTVTSKLPFVLKSPVLVFIGGYGQDYDEALRQFLACAKNLRGYSILITYHPKMEGKVERKELEKMNLPHVHLVESSWNISNMEAIALADQVICHQSSTGVEAAAAGKHVIYFIPSGQTYTNLLIERGGAPLVSSFTELETSLNAKRDPHTDPFEVLKVPEQSVTLIYDQLHAR